MPETLLFLQDDTDVEVDTSSEAYKEHLKWAEAHEEEILKNAGS